MKLDPIVLASPMYFALMAVEWLIDRKRRAGLYRLNDALTNLACGFYQQILMALLVVPLGAPYRWVYEHHRVTDWFAAHPALAWAAAFVGSDFFYYWFHRWSHESAAGWFSHVVHHQSEDYNLSVALRQDAWQPLFSLWFQLPLAWLGLPPETFVTAYGVMIVYQFWIHTKLIDRMGPLEWVMNTPSHHRAHHAIAERYLRCNYAGVFIVWDRLFGSFEPEAGEMVYGTIEPLRSWNPVWAHLQYGALLRDRMRAARTRWDAIQVLLRGTDWMPPGVTDRGHGDPTRYYDVRTPPALRRYAVALFATAMAPGLAATTLEHTTAMSLRASLAVTAVWAMANVGGFLESRWWARASQKALLALVALGGVALATTNPLWLAVTAAAAALWATMPRV
jgi:alkylglycerol monooxygenase